MKQKVIYLSYDGLTDPLGQSQVIPYLKGLAEDYSIFVISFEKASNYAQKKDGIIQEVQDYFDWLPMKYTKWPPILSTIWDIFKLKRVCSGLCSEHIIKVIHCRSYITSLIGLSMKKKYGVKFLFDMRGFWADERVDGNIWNLNNPIFKKVYDFFKKKEKEFLTSADFTISLTHEAKTEIHSWEEIPNQPIEIEVIPCCADLDLFNPSSIIPAQKSQLAKRLEIKPDEFVLSYLGSIGTWYMLDEMLLFFKRLCALKKNAKFLFITNENESYIRGKARKISIDNNAIVVREATRQEVPAYLSLSDVSLFFIKPVYSKKASSPTKQAEIMGMGIPFVANANVGDSNYFHEKSKVGLLVNEFNTKEFDRIIGQIDLILSKDRMSIVSEAHKYFSLTSGIKKYKRVYDLLLG